MRKREGERERKREMSTIVIFIFKGITGALTPVSYLVLNISVVKDLQSL